MKEFFQGRSVEYTDLNRDDRSRLRPIVGAVIAAILFGGLTLYSLLYSKPARGEEIPTYVVDHHQGVRMRLMPSPCTDGISLMMVIQGTPETYHSRFKAISSEWLANDGKWHSFPGCWLELTAEEAKAPGAVFVLVFSDGTHYTLLKKDLLKKSPGA